MKLKLYHLLIAIVVIMGALTIADVITVQNSILTTLFLGGIFRITQLKQKLKDSYVKNIEDYIKQNSSINEAESRIKRLIEINDELIIQCDLYTALNKALIKEFEKRCNNCDKNQEDIKDEPVDEPVEQKIKKPRSKKPKKDETI